MAMMGVPRTSNLAEPCEAIRAAFGRTDRHIHRFIGGGLNGLFGFIAAWRDKFHEEHDAPNPRAARAKKDAE